MQPSDHQKFQTNLPVNIHLSMKCPRNESQKSKLVTHQDPTLLQVRFPQEKKGKERKCSISEIRACVFGHNVESCLPVHPHLPSRQENVLEPACGSLPRRRSCPSTHLGGVRLKFRKTAPATRTGVRCLRFSEERSS